MNLWNGAPFSTGITQLSSMDSPRTLKETHLRGERARKGILKAEKEVGADTGRMDEAQGAGCMCVKGGEQKEVCWAVELGSRVRKPQGDRSLVGVEGGTVAGTRARSAL